MNLQKSITTFRLISHIYFFFSLYTLAVTGTTQAVTYRQGRDMTYIKQTEAEQNTRRRHLQPS